MDFLSPLFSFLCPDDLKAIEEKLVEMGGKIPPMEDIPELLSLSDTVIFFFFFNFLFSIIFLSFAFLSFLFLFLTLLPLLIQSFLFSNARKHNLSNYTNYKATKEQERSQSSLLSLLALLLASPSLFNFLFFFFLILFFFFFFLKMGRKLHSKIC